jgi:hypothetical protein
MEVFKTFLDKIGSATAAIGAAALAAALLAYFRAEASSAIRWLFGPLAKLLPWNAKQSRTIAAASDGLTSELTVVDLYLTSPDGKRAKYEKTSYYLVAADRLSSYREAVTTSGTIDSISTEVGVITQTSIEHGFLVSKIDLGSAFQKGAHFKNVFRVTFHNSFLSEEEHWTHEIIPPTKHFALRVHFPIGRPPKLIRSKRLIGLESQIISGGAHLSDLFETTTAVWEINSPNQGEIFKLEWRW